MILLGQYRQRAATRGGTDPAAEAFHRPSSWKWCAGARSCEAAQGQNRVNIFLVGYHIALDHTVDNVIKIIQRDLPAGPTHARICATSLNLKKSKSTGAGNQVETLKGVKIDRKKYGLLDARLWRDASWSRGWTGELRSRLTPFSNCSCHELTRLSVTTKS